MLTLELGLTTQVGGEVTFPLLCCLALSEKEIGIESVKSTAQRPKFC